MSYWKNMTRSALAHAQVRPAISASAVKCDVSTNSWEKKNVNINDTNNVEEEKAEVLR